MSYLKNCGTAMVASVPRQARGPARIALVLAALLAGPALVPSGIGVDGFAFAISQAAAQPVPEDMLERARGIISDLLGVDPSQIAAETRFVEDLNADELDLLEVAMAMEEEFGVEISDEKIEAITTVGDLVAAAAGR
jgi:acyl carrier protein